MKKDVEHCPDCRHAPHDGYKCHNMASDNDCNCDRTKLGVVEEKSDAQKLLDQRRAVYGDRVDNMIRVAQMWSGFLGTEIQPWQVPVMFALYKVYRLGITPDYSDNIDDVDGYMLMFREMIGENMIQARTVEEYLEELNRRATEDQTFPESIMDAVDRLEGRVHVPGEATNAEGAMIEGWTNNPRNRR